MAELQRQPPASRRGELSGPSGKLRWLISALLVFHLAAVIISPLSVPPSSATWNNAWWVFRPYLEMMYLNHGYKYFAPEPGPSTLLAYTLEFDDGSTLEETIPHRGIRPRLLYHRHFMLTEFLNFAPEDWHRAYARHLCQRYGAESVTMSRMTRLLPTMEDVRNGSTLTDPSRYLETPLGSFRCDDL
jgi:hypothetical protein